jgi:hypothetical protein
VKEEFRVPGQDKIDTTKIPPGVQYPDLWEFEVCVPRVNGMSGEFVPHKTFHHYADLLEYMTVVYQKHIAQQDKLMETVGKIGPEPLCECSLPVSLCRCSAPETGPMLFGEMSMVSQSGDTCTRKHRVRTAGLNGHKHMLFSKYTDKVVRAYISQIYDDPDIARWFKVDFCDPSVSPDDNEITVRINTLVDDALSEFLTLDPRDRMNALSDGAFSRVDEGPDLVYLTFEPRFGPRGHFLESQLTTIRDVVMQFCGTLDAKETALLDVYIQEDAPLHISNGWCMGDIVKGGYDYVKYYATQVEDPDRTQVREFLLGTRKKFWYERLGVAVAVAYFERKWVYNTINFFASIPLAQRGFLWCVKKATNSPMQDLTHAARAHDQRLGGDNKVVRNVLVAMTLLSAVAIIAKLAVMFRPAPKHEVRVPSEGSVATCSTCNYPNSPLPSEVGEPVVLREDSPDDHEVVYTQLMGIPMADLQMDLEAVGRRPTVREAEKKNVWTVKERAITRLDVDARRPHNESQLVHALHNNVVFARVYGEMPLGKGRANTRVLVVDSETFVINNHALPTPCKIEIWLGPVTEEGVKPSFVVEVDDRMVTRHPSRDIAIVTSWAMPHRFKTIKHLFARRSFQSVGPSSYHVRHEDHSVEVLPCVGVTLAGLEGLSGAEGVVCEAWASRPTRATVSGECGSPLVIHSSLGSVIVGIHAGYNVLTNTAWAVKVYAEDFDHRVHPQVGTIKPAYPVAQVGGFLKLGPQDKLYTDYHKDGHIMTHGQLKSFVARPKFTGTHTPYATHVFAVGHTFSPPIVDNMAAPRNSGWKQPQLVLENYLHPTHSMNEMVMRACVEAYCEHIDNHFTEQDWQDVHPVPISVAVNGFPGVPNVDAQKHATSAGHGKRGPKLQFLTEPEKFDVWDSFRRYDAATLREIDEMRDLMHKGIRPHAIYDACWKNELLSKEKVEAGKARSIYMCPLAFLTNIRMSTMALCRVLIRRRDVMGIAVGLNTHSEEWDDVHRLACLLPGDNWIAGDFKAFEAVLNLLISNCTSKVFAHIAERCGNYDYAELLAFRVMLADISNATINFFGELITLLGGEASGHQLTTFFNCVANNLLHMYAYVELHKGDEQYVEYLRCAREFFDKVFRNTLGDDVYMKVHPDRPTYNHTSIQSVFAAIGVQYTMAEKGAASRPYIPLEEVTFLKRNFVDHSAFPGMKVAALDRRSIYKMLCYTVPSHSASAEEQLAASLASAQAEAFFHDYDFFKQVETLIASLPRSAELQFRLKENPPPTWNGMVTRFVNASPKLKARMLVPGDSETTQTKRNYCHASELELQTAWSVDAWGSTTMGRSPEDRVYGGVRLSADIVPTDAMCEIARVPDNNDFSKNQYKETKKSPTTEQREMAPKVVAQAINKVRTQLRNRKRRDKWSGVAQADIAYDTGNAPGTGAASSVDSAHQQVVFKNEPAGAHITVKTHTDSLVTIPQLPQVLGSYFSRPVRIFTYVWAENGANGLKTSFEPWRLFFTHPNMNQKLQGYGLLRCKLKLKFLINGSPFYYGSMMAAYTPLSGWRTDTVGAGLGTYLVPTSQKPHVWLENQNCSTAEMELPFFYPFPYMQPSVTKLGNMGRVDLAQFAPLLSANGTSSSNVDIQVYAWAEDVHLSGPTNLPVAQSEFVHDGQISSVASAVADAAGALSQVPVLGPYARATEMASRMVSGVASHFGFTNVPNIEDVRPMKSMPFQLASTAISEPVHKLSVQPKQETAIGAEQHGGPSEDELTLSSFCTRTSFLTGTEWPTTLEPGSLLFSSVAAPGLFESNSTEIAHTPVSYVSNHFQYWRGSLKFTFKVVRSPYHRGRLAISWDQNAENLSSTPSIGNPNTISTIMDLDETSECSFVVPYMREQLFMQTGNIINQSGPRWSVDPNPSSGFTGVNGIIGVRVLNRLTAPEASSAVTILVFVSAGDDFEFAGPREQLVLQPSYIMSLSPSVNSVIQSHIQYDDAAESHEVTPTGSPDVLYHQTFGERVSSLRELMHRSSLSFIHHAREGTGVFGGCDSVRLPIKRLPPPPGVYNNGWWQGNTSAGANQRVFWTKYHPIVAFGACFLGYKGSVNVTVNVDQPRNTSFVDTLSAYRMQFGGQLTNGERRPSKWIYGNTANPTSFSTAADLREIPSGAAGTALTNTKTNAGLSVQLPYYSTAGFHIMDPDSEYSNQVELFDNNSDWWRVEWRYNKADNATTSDGAMTSVFYGTGPDFDLLYFINIPVMHRVGVTASPA